MDAETARRAHEILARAAELPVAEQARFLAEACGDHSELRTRLEAMLVALRTSDTFLETPALGAQAVKQTNGLEPADDPSAERVGGYCILRVIGAGGMATVYEAEQDHPRRRVAVKMMRQALLHTSAIERFKYETQVLASLQHPGIAQIFEAGTWNREGVSIPFFAMEYVVDAMPINQFAIDKKLSPEKKLELFLLVCDAVQYGHQRGVLHRDINPANILIGLQGQPKVIDFGVARSTDPGHGGLTASSDIGQIIGTLNYMSPEQCDPKATVDTRCDIYSLGVVLYEMLCGELPLHLEDIPLPEALRLIREVDPSRPSLIGKNLSDDLDAIVMTALCKNPDGRYRAVEALAGDIRRWLNHLPIEARRPTLVYQARLFARRNRTLVVASMIVAITILIGAASSVTFAIRAMRQSHQRLAAEEVAIRERDSAVRNAYFANMSAGFSAQQVGELQEVRAQLAAAPEQLRGWEWHFLKSVSQRSIQTVFAHDDLIHDIAISRDASLLATASKDGVVKVWQTDGIKLMATLAATVPGQVYCVTFDPEGKRVAAGYPDGTIRIWDVASGVEQSSRRLHRERVQRIAWPREGMIVSASTDGKCIVWNASDGKVIQELGGHGIVASRDGATLLTWITSGEKQGVVRVWRGSPLSVVREVQFGPSLYCAAISDDSRWIAAAGEPSRVVVWPMEQDRPGIEHVIPGKVSLVRNLSFARDGSVVAASLGGDRSVELIPLTGGTQEKLLGHEDAVVGAHFSPDARWVYSTSFDRTIRVWGTDLNTRADFVRKLKAGDAQLLDATFLPDSSAVVGGGRDGVIRVFSPESGAEIAQLRGHTNDISSIDVSRDGEWIASGSYDRTVRLWKTATGEPGPILADHTAAVWCVAFSPDGRLLASGGEDQIVRLWDTTTGVVTRKLSGQKSRIVDVKFNPAGHLVAAASRDGTIRLWEAGSGKTVRVLNGHASDVFAVLFSSDGKLLYSGSRDQSVRVWDVETGECLKVLDGHGQFITSLALSPDGSRLVGGSWFGQVVLWDVATHRVVATLRGDLGVIRSVAFSPNGRWIAAAGYQGNVHLFDSADPQTRMRSQSNATTQPVRLFVPSQR